MSTPSKAALIRGAEVLFNKLAAARADAERLDWLDTHPSHYLWNVEVKYGCVFVCRNCTSGHKTIREAIDARKATP